MHKILVVGQTPPPYGGQAIMIEKLLKGTYSNAKLYHVRMAFSKEMDELGKFKVNKFLHLFVLIFKICYNRIAHSCTVLYYPPSGPDNFPIIRDMAVLLPTRWMFKKTIFHFHAAGISEFDKKVTGIFRALFRKSFYYPTIAIRLSKYNPDDARGLLAKNERIIPNGIEDKFAECSTFKHLKSPIPTILFVGFLRETKGVLILLQAAKMLCERRVSFKIKIMGKYESFSFYEKLQDFIRTNNLEKNVEFLGVLLGIEKDLAYQAADIFCFPSFFESESFGLVVLEAMQFGLPIITTRWRGLQSLVDDGINGFLVPIKDSNAIAEKIELLIAAPSLREVMGQRGRKKYVDQFTDNKFYENMQSCFDLLDD